MATRPLPTLTLPAARLAASACEARAHALNTPMNIAIVDATLTLLHFCRMDNAKLTSVSIAIDKAFTAAGHRVGTHTYKEAVWPGGAAYGIAGSNGGRFCVIGGGVPVVDGEGRVVGGVGCSAGTPAQDRECAEAGVGAVERWIREGGEGEEREEGTVKARL